jgi:hypothetical protein
MQQTQGLESLESLADARQALAIQGRYGDTTIGHLTPGEMVLPRPIADDPVLKRQLFDAFERHELNPYQYQVGHFENSINPLTGAPEFGFFKKIGKFLKKAAPTIGQVVGFALGGPAGAAIGGGIGGAVKEGSLKGALKHAAQGYVLGSVGAGMGLKGGQGIGSIFKGGAKGGMWNFGATPTDAGGIGGFFQNVGARGASALGGGSVEGTQAANLFGKEGAWDSLSTMGKMGVGGLGLAALGGFEAGKDDSQMPGPSGELGGYLQRPLSAAALPTQYGTEGVGVGGPGGMAMGSGITGGGMIDPATAAYLRATMGDEEYSKLMFPEFTRQMVAGGGAIYELDMRGGGESEGPGNGVSDDIPAMLSDGEFVMTKQSVMGMGDGDHEKGIQTLYAMMDRNENKAQQMGIGRA